MIVLCCPRCGTDVPDGDLSSIIRFYSGDVGLGETCPGCGAGVWWQMAVRIERTRGGGRGDRPYR